jgi:hypothetical protein
MGEVVQFPNFTERTWLEIKPMIDAALRSSGAPPAAADWICDDLKKRYAALQTDLSLSLEIPAECRECVDKLFATVTELVHEVSNRGLMQMILMETELYFAKHPNP